MQTLTRRTRKPPTFANGPLKACVRTLLDYPWVIDRLMRHRAFMLYALACEIGELGEQVNQVVCDQDATGQLADLIENLRSSGATLLLLADEAAQSLAATTRRTR